jgi:hypothetical protein
MTGRGRIGSESSGAVNLVENPANEQLIGLKTFDLGDENETLKFQLFMPELEAYLRLPHPCVLKVMGFMLPGEGVPGKIGTKSAENGSLRDAIKARRGRESSPCLDDTGSPILQSLSHLHLHQFGNRPTAVDI